MESFLNFDDVSKYSEMHEVFNFDFSTHMLFRCTKKKYAEELKKGRFRFNQPKSWIEEGEKGNIGLGDLLEGVCLSANCNDKSDFILSLKENKEFENFIKDDKIYFRRSQIKNLYCFCLYGLNSNVFIEDNDYCSKIDKDYFSAFTDIEKKEDYNRNDENRDVVVFIRNPHKFFEKIKEFFINLGIEKNDIIISPIQYVNYSKDFICLVPFPKELLLKDNYYSNQCEIRVIINSYDDDLIKYMNDNHNIIDIGDISDFVDIYDYYFDDMVLKKENNELLFSLPFSEKIDLVDLKLRDLLSIFVQVYNNKLPYEVTSEERNNILEYIKNVILEKYKIYLTVKDGLLCFSNVVGNLEDILDK